MARRHFGVRILFVVPNVPSFIRPRPFNFIRQLSRIHEVSVLCLATNDSDERFISELQKHCQQLEVVKLPRWRSLWNCLLAMCSDTSLRCAYFYSSQLRRRVGEKVSRGEVDLLHAEHLKSVPLVEGVLGRVPAVFDAVDCISMFEARRRKVLRNPLSKAFSWTERRKMVRWEVKAVRLFDRTLVSSDIDKQCYPVPCHLREKLDVIRNAVDLEYFGFQRFEPQRNLIVFCAKLDYFPNQDAALYFARSVWPLLRTLRPELVLQIVGSRPPRSVEQLDGKDNIRVIGSVPDVRPFLGSAWVALCPIRARAGIQFKILEAMALGVPIVATRICCPGLAAEAGKHLLVADTPQEFVSAVELLLENHALRASLVQAGRKYVEENHDWSGCLRQLSDTYAKAIAAFSESRQAPSATYLTGEA